MGLEMTSSMTKALCGLVLLLGITMASAEDRPATPESTELNAIPYYSDKALKKADDYQRKQCQLDLYYPTNTPGFATVIWFHGGGLTSGTRAFPNLKGQGIALVSVSYRLSPQGKLPCFLEDAAAAVAWTLRNIEKYGGDPKKVFVSGHSAGGYLTAMIGMDPRWLAAQGVSNKQLAGLIPVSAQVTTHFEVKKLRGDKGDQFRPIIDEYAPLYYAAADLPPICLVTGDRRIEFPCRVEENDFLAASLRKLGHPHVEFYEMGGLNHGTVCEGSVVLIREFVRKTVKEMDAAKNPPVPAATAKP